MHRGECVIPLALITDGDTCVFLLYQQVESGLASRRSGMVAEGVQYEYSRISPGAGGQISCGSPGQAAEERIAILIYL